MLFRSGLRLIVLVMDIRHPLQPVDREWLDLIGGSPVTLAIILNKADCLGRMQQKKAEDQVAHFCRSAHIPANLYRVSSREGVGIETLRVFIGEQLSLGDTAGQ